MIWIIIVALALFIAWLIMPGKTLPGSFEPFYGRYFAHRGLHNTDREGGLIHPAVQQEGGEAIIPENSMAAFHEAVQAGYGIELDIQLSADGQVVVFHDDDLLRVCGVEGMVANHTYEQMQQLPLMGSEERMPLLANVLALVDGKVPLIVELKRGWRNRQLCQSAWALLRQYSGPFCIESFDPSIVRWFRNNAPGVVRGQLSAPGAELDSGIGGYILALGLASFLGRPHFTAYQAVRRPPFVRLCQRLSQGVAWTVTPEHDITALEQENDALIFEYFTPKPRYKGGD